MPKHNQQWHFNQPANKAKYSIDRDRFGTKLALNELNDHNS